ncbi:M23 family metallopeptidase [Haloarchaeobius sp. DFWS5]|uniref:M23 family metallopeptidase n=1 Tax=Haloarchaeobius sp. DFWS5 TaxID=3446114 RepID=UPI003EB6DDF9
MSRWRRFDPASLAVLGLLGIPSVFDHGPDWLRFFLLFPLLSLVPMLRTLRRGGGETDENDPLGYSRKTTVRFLFSQLIFGITPWGFLTSIGQLVGQLVPLARHRGSLPSPETYDQRTTYRLPFDGDWLVVNGGVTRSESHSWSLYAQRYAHDFLQSVDGSTHIGEGGDCEAYHCFGEPILAPASGTVVTAADGLRDHPRPGTGWTEWRTWNILGNHVVVDHGDDEYSFLCHLQQGSVSVSAGETVEMGQRVGRCGNSGNSSEPHLHFHVQDHPNFFLGAGVPVAFGEFERERDGTNESVEPDYLTGGDTVRVRTAQMHTQSREKPQ